MSRSLVFILLRLLRYDSFLFSFFRFVLAFLTYFLAFVLTFVLSFFLPISFILSLFLNLALKIVNKIFGLSQGIAQSVAYDQFSHILEFFDYIISRLSSPLFILCFLFFDLFQFAFIESLYSFCFLFEFSHESFFDIKYSLVHFFAEIRNGIIFLISFFKEF
jgi:hypothetical protein